MGHPALPDNAPLKIKIDAESGFARNAAIGPTMQFKTASKKEPTDE